MWYYCIMGSTIETGTHAFGSYYGDPEELRKLEDRLKQPSPWHEIHQSVTPIESPAQKLQTPQELQAEQDYIEQRIRFPERD